MRIPTRWLALGAGGLSIAAFGWALALTATDGVRFRLLGLSVSSQDPVRPFVAAGVLGVVGAVAVWRLGGWAKESGRARLARAGVALAMAVVAALTVKHGAFVAGGADASGYVSQAALWASGSSLRVVQPLAKSVPWAHPEWTFAPLGYRPATVPAAMVPTYPPGLPLLMALARTAFGEPATYIVVPILGLLAVWLTFRLTALMAGRIEALGAAWVFALSPTFLRHVTQPMSDVPAAALWMAALASVWWHAGVMGAVAAGALSGIAVLVRPNLAPLCLVVALAGAMASPSGVVLRRRAAGFVCGLTPGVVALAVLNRYLYGSPTASGYGSLESLFAWQHVGPNLHAYASWLADCETPWLALGVLAPLVVGTWTRAPGSPKYLCVAGVVFASLNVLLYLPYLVFDDWSYLRFFLPALAVMYAVLFAGIGALAGRAGPRARIACVGTLAIVLSLVHVRAWPALDVFGPGRVMPRFVEAADYVRRRTPPAAVIVCMEHSGSIRYYTDRVVLRYDFLPAERLDAAVEDFARQGRPVLFVLDDWETERFRARFSGVSRYGGLSWRPAEVLHAASRVYVFAAADAGTR